MVKAASICMTVAVIAYFEVRSMLKKGRMRELVVFFVLLAIGTGLVIAYTLHVELPNPLEPVRYLFEPVGKWIFAQLS